MNLRDREFPDRRGARREAAPRSSRPAPAFVPSTRAVRSQDLGMRPVASANATPTARHADAGPEGSGRQPGHCDRPRGGARPARPAVAAPLDLARGGRLRARTARPGVSTPRGARPAWTRPRPDQAGPQYADILAAHCRMIADPTLRGEAREMIEHELTSAEHAVLDVLEKLVVRLEQLSGSHLSARAADVRDIESRILSHLIGELPASFQDELAAPAILLAHDLTPSQAAGIEPRLVPGFATEGGGRASHTAIVAAALEIPAVVGLGKFLDRAQHCRMAIIDGDEGLVILDPDPETQERYHKIAAERSAWFQVLTRQADLPAETLDGTPIELWGNIEFGGEVDACLERGAKGVGLFRTEFLFLNALTPPSEDQQFEVYASVVGSMRGRPIIIRTLDLGADKLPAYQSTGPSRVQSGSGPAELAALVA